MGLQWLLINVLVSVLLSGPKLTASIPSADCVSLTFTGDVCVGKSTEKLGRFDKLYKTHGPEYFFEGIRPIIENDDFTIINLENVFTNEATPQSGKIWNYKANKKYIDVIKSSSIEVASLANNHMQDYLQTGLNDTVRLLDRAQVQVTGFNRGVSGPELGGVYLDRRAIIEKNGITIGVLGYMAFASHHVPTEKILEDVTALKLDMQVDYIVAMVHWGAQNTREVTDKQKSEGERFIDCGVDLVVGNHPHVLQQMAVYKTKHIYYSLGNLVFAPEVDSDMPETILLSLTLTRSFDGLLKEKFNHIPVRYTGNTRFNSMQPVVVADEDYLESIRRILIPCPITLPRELL